MPVSRQVKDRAGVIRLRDFEFREVKLSDDAPGLFSGYGSIFGNVDEVNDIVAPGAFAKSLKQWSAIDRPVPILWQHRSGEPIGVYTKIVEDDKGLRIEGRLLVDDVLKARETYALMKIGAVSGLSIGYFVVKSEFNEKTNVRTLVELDLVEISLVTFPANEDARVDAVKFKLAHGGLPTLPEFEKVLREAGFSKTQAAVVANRGLTHLLRSESEGEIGRAHV